LVNYLRQAKGIDRKSHLVEAEEALKGEARKEEKREMPSTSTGLRISS
jgi:hypothetical protein